VLITILVLPLLFITLPLKLFSKEQAKKESTFSRLVQQNIVMSKLKRQVAAIKIQKAFRDHLKKRKDAAIKIQTIFRNHLKVKKAKAEENKWINKFRNYVSPYFPYLKQQSKQWAYEGIKALQQKGVNLLCEALMIEVGATLGLTPDDVRFATLIGRTEENFC
jgi:hypothetical protein